MALSAMELQLEVFESLQTTQVMWKQIQTKCTHDLRACALDSCALWLSRHVYLHAQTAVDAGDVCI